MKSIRHVCCGSAALILVAGDIAAAAAQDCRLPESIRVEIPDSAPVSRGYSTVWGGAVPFPEVPLGIGHLHYSPAGPLADLPPGDYDWLRRVELPLSESPGEEPFAWIAGGWVLASGRPPVASTTDGMVETGYEDPSFIVLERSDGWFRIRYGTGMRDDGTAWTPACALGASPARLAFAAWSEWFLSGEIAPLFFRVAVPQELRAQPAAGSATVGRVAGDYVLVPREVRGEWMRVELRQPSDYCAPDVNATTIEGWIRWFAPDIGPRVWYFTRGC